MDLFACSTWRSKAVSPSAAATPPVAEAAVSSMALYNAANIVGGYTAGTFGAMMHDCVKWVCTGQRALKQAQEWQTVLELAQPKRQDDEFLHLRYGGNRTRAEQTSKSHKVFDLNHSANRVYTIGTEGSHHI